MNDLFEIVSFYSSFFTKGSGQEGRRRAGSDQSVLGIGQHQY
jgi:hypothetical protein